MSMREACFQGTPDRADQGGMSRAAKWLRGALLLLSLIAWNLAPAQAAEGKTAPAAGSAAKVAAHAAAKPWDESAGLQMTCADTLDSSARIFDSPDYQQQLLVPGGGESAYVLGLKALSVQVLPKKALGWDENDKPVPDLSHAAAGGSFLREADVISFSAGGSDWKVQPEPPLIGSLPLAKLLEAKPDYAHAAARFVPAARSVKALHGVAAETKFVVFYGTWCRFCKRWIPRFLRTMEEAKNPKFTAEFVGMNEDQTEPGDLIKKYGVTQTPTIIVRQGGKELGRIEEKPQDSIEADLAKILGAR